MINSEFIDSLQMNKICWERNIAGKWAPRCYVNSLTSSEPRETSKTSENIETSENGERS